MTATTYPPLAPAPVPQPGRSTGARVVGSILIVIGALAAISGGALLYLFGGDRVLASAPHPISTPTSAVVTDLGTITNTNGVSVAIVSPTLHVSASGSADRPIFIGVGPADAVDQYLEGVGAERVIDLELIPVRPEHRPSARLASGGSSCRAGLLAGHCADDGSRRPHLGNPGRQLQRRDHECGRVDRREHQGRRRRWATWVVCLVGIGHRRGCGLRDRRHRGDRARREADQHRVNKLMQAQADRRHRIARSRHQIQDTRFKATGWQAGDSAPGHPVAAYRDGWAPRTRFETALGQCCGVLRAGQSAASTSRGLTAQRGGANPSIVVPIAPSNRTDNALTCWFGSA